MEDAGRVQRVIAAKRDINLQMTDVPSSDKTYKTFLARHKELSSEREKELLNLKNGIRSLKLGTKRCIAFAEGQTNWINYDDDISVFHQSQDEIKSSLDEIWDAQVELQEVEQNIASLKQNLTALKVEDTKSLCVKGAAVLAG